MSIDDQPMNVYWSGKRTETSNTFKITDKGSVAEYTDLPSSGNQKGDKYEVTDDGSDYIWDGSAWSRLGAEKYAYEDIVGMPNFALDANVVHKTETEEITGVKYATQLFHKSTTIDTTSIPGSTQYKNGSTVVDKNNVNLNELYFSKDAENTHELVLRLWSANKTYATYFHMTLDSSGNGSVHLGHRAKVFYPDLADTDLGKNTTTNRWGQIYSSSTTISTSDGRMKASVESVPDAVLDAWGSVPWVQFQMRDAIEKKGEEAARLHNGLIAQSIDDAFAAAGLDASRYGLFCYDEWEYVPEKRDPEGHVISPAVDAGSAFSVRYAEALCMEAAYQRRRADRAEARLAVLEERLSALEAKYPE